ncbi:MAG: hypothetical protein IJ549_04110 [Prevotella sp.]|nr:hypothetical protein [Prevotella sp.]
MKKRNLLFTLLALVVGCLTGGSVAMAESGDNGWSAVTTQTQTSITDWEVISSGSTTGRVLGAASAVKYYYVDRSLTFTNNNPGGSGLTILGTVYLYIPADVQIKCVGADANGATGAGAGIELANGNKLYIIGSGATSTDPTSYDVETYGPSTVNAIGGNAANGSNGGRGGNAGFSYDSWIATGAGGTGGNGGGGAGAGIGSRGGDGGNGGAGGAEQSPNYDSHTNGTNGINGSNGGNGVAMGSLYVANGITVNATGGIAATSGGTGGSRGTCAVENSVSKNYSMAGGGGGGGGGFGGAASNIGTGGPGGGGGGGGAGGTQERCQSGYLAVYAKGGVAGKNADGNKAEDGEDAYIYGDWENGLLITNYDSWSSNDWDGNVDATEGTPGSGGAKGSNTSAGSANTGTKTYTITFNAAKSTIDTDGTPLTKTVTYSPSIATSVILPQNEEGYQWALYVYGKRCKANSNVTTSKFTEDTKDYFGGNYDDEAYRTIVLNDVYGDLVFVEVKSTCILKDRNNNDNEIGDFYVAAEPDENAPKWPINVRLQNRTLYRDGYLNTICLPFSLTSSEISKSPLQGATIYKMNQEVTGYYPNGYEDPSTHINYNYPIIRFNFTTLSASDGIEAGKPYMVKWSGYDPGNDLEDNTVSGIHNLDFKKVTVTSNSVGSWVSTDKAEAGVITFIGTYGLSDNLNGTRYLVLGDENTLYYPTTTINIGSCRGYFVLPEGVAASAREIIMDFDDNETTSIKMVNGSASTVQGSKVYYNLNGQRLNAPQKGINIVNGKKILVK